MSTYDGHHSKGQETANDKDLKKFTREKGGHLTTNRGLQISHDQNSLRAVARGPTLLEDFHLRETITHFDQERFRNGSFTREAPPRMDTFRFMNR